uniref:Uncharacterized protein n=1 Tax=Klebsormidium flaccidum TaxID=3175 RepID=A0A0B5H501_KLEFL|nr:hypothetical protein [Klebsormidium flaccidum]
MGGRPSSKEKESLFSLTVSIHYPNQKRDSLVCYPVEDGSPLKSLLSASQTQLETSICPNHCLSKKVFVFFCLCAPSLSPFSPFPFPSKTNERVVARFPIIKRIKELLLKAAEIETPHQ